MNKTNRAQQGFSLLETIVVMGIMMALVSFAMIQSFGSLESYRANAAMDVITSQLRVARQLAISQRRNVLITFNTSSTSPSITYAVQPNPGDVTTPSPVTLPIAQQVSFTGVSGEMDTPMGFGTCSTYGVCIGPPNNPVSGGPPAGMYFTSIGQLTDATLVNPLNGTVFMAVPNQLSTARAVTIMGATGRVRSYSFVGGSTSQTAWTE